MVIIKKIIKFLINSLYYSSLILGSLDIFIILLPSDFIDTVIINNELNSILLILASILSALIILSCYDLFNE